MEGKKKFEKPTVKKVEFDFKTRMAASCPSHCDNFCPYE